MIELRPYQEEALDAIERSDERRQLVALPTGTGKTVVFAKLIERRGGTALVLAHRDELLQQAADKLRTVAPALAMSLGLVRAEANNVRAPVVIASVQTLARERRRAQLPGRFDTVVVDEAHHATAASYRAILEHVGGSPLVVGFTATPERADRGRLADVFDEVTYARSLEEMIEEGYLCDLRAVRVTLQELNLKKVKTSGGDFQAGALGVALEDAGAVEHAVGAYRDHAPGRRCVAFFPTVQLSRATAAAFCAAGVPALHVDGTTPRDERRAIIEALRSGEASVVCNVGVLTEGFDEPALDCILIAAPTKSRVKYMQMIGRGTRLYPGKEDCLVLDLAGMTATMSLQSVAAIFGAGEDETVGQAKQRQDAEAGERDEREQRRARRRSEEVDLFDRERIHWRRVGDRWVVDAGRSGMIVLDPHGEGSAPYRVMIVGENRARIAARNLDLGYAQGTAEHLIRQSEAVKLADKQAAWREDAATPGQVKYLVRLNRKVARADMTKGEAADAITEALAADRLARLDRALAEREAAA